VATTTTTTLSAAISTYYDRLLLERAKKKVVMGQFAQRRPLPEGEGKTAYFTRYQPLSKVTSALSEGENPDSPTTLSAVNVTATVSEWGEYVKLTSLVLKTAIDPNVKEKVELLGENAGKSIDWQIMKEVCENGTAQLVSTVSALSDIAATDILTPTDIRKAARDLDNNDARYIDGYYVAVVDPYTKFDISGDDDWVTAAEYEGAERLFTGELGRWMNVRFVWTSQPYRSDTSGTQDDDGAVHWTPVFGGHAYGLTELESLRVIVHDPETGGTENPLNRYGTVGWSATFATKVLNDDWIRVIKSGATA